MNTIESLEQNEDFQRMPEWLRKLLEAELAAGNSVIEIFHSFPAPPAGACFRLAKPLITRTAQANDGLDYCQRTSSLYSGEITDSKRCFFLIEPPLPLPPEPDMDAIRAANRLPQSTPVAPAMASSLVERFKSSMVIDSEKWHDGIGYDVDLIAQMNDAEKREIENLLVTRSDLKWFDVEALAAINSRAAKERLAKAAASSDFSIRHSVQRFAPELIITKDRTESLVQALRDSNLYGGLSKALDEAAEFHPPEVVQALLDGAQNRDGESACLMAAMLFYIHGIADEPFDMNHRPFLLRFNTTDLADRALAFAELCERIGNNQ